MRRQNKKKWWIALVIVLAISIVLAVYFFVNKEENRDYTNPETYIGLSVDDAVRRADASGLEYNVIDYDKQSETIITGTIDLVLLVSDGKIVDAEYREIPDVQSSN